MAALTGRKMLTKASVATGCLLGLILDNLSRWTGPLDQFSGVDASWFTNPE